MVFGKSRTLRAGVLAAASIATTAVRGADPQQSAPQPQPLAQVSDPGSDASAPPSFSRGNFFERLARFYAADWRGKLPAEPTPARRAFDAPMTPPPYPSGDWLYGGSPTLGVPDTNVYPLMTALKLNGHRTKVYGWAKGTYNASTSSENNYPLVFASAPDSARLHQVVTFLERLPDSVQ